MERLKGIFPGVVRVTREEGDDVPAAQGSYLLGIELSCSVSIVIGHEVNVVGPGLYCYAGSARGPGGIRGRVRRHFRRDKKSHWHVDQLTQFADDLWALAFPGGKECAVVRVLDETGRFIFPAAGFGSSDCRTCEAHLMRWIPETGRTESK